MKIKKVPLGAKIVRLINIWGYPCKIYWKREPIIYIEAKSQLIMIPQQIDMGNGRLTEFPEMQFFCKFPIRMEWV